MKSTTDAVPLEKLLEQLPNTYTLADKELVQRAYRVAEEAHRGQKRNSGEPYISHCLAVAQILAEGLSGTVPQLAGVLTQLAAPARFGAEPIDVHSAREYVAQRSDIKQPSMHEIALAASRHFSLRLADVRSSVRRRALVTARGVAVYLARHDAGKSLQEIGRYFGGRDHTTVMHSCRQTELMSESDPTIHEAIEQLRKELWKT